MTPQCEEMPSAPAPAASTGLAAVVPFHADWLASFEAWSATLSPAVRWHAEMQERHFIRRARERYGLTVSPSRYRYWIRKVEDYLPGTEFVCSGDSRERTFWTIRSGSYRLRVLYDETTRRLVTCYPSAQPEVMPQKRWQRLRARRSFVDTDYLEMRRRLNAA